MQSHWPNPVFVVSGKIADSDVFSDPPTHADKGTAHQMVARQYLGISAFVAARLLSLFPVLLQDAVGSNVSSNVEGYVNLFGLACLVGAAVLYVVALKVFIQAVFSPQMVAAQKLVYARPKTGWRFVAKMTVICISVLAGYVGILGADWLARHYQLPHSAGVIFEAAITAFVACLMGWLAYRQMTIAFNVLQSGDLNVAKPT
jgi:hypothetical protein